MEIMDEPSKPDYATPAPSSDRTYRRIASISAALGAVVGIIRTIDQLRYDPPLA